MILLDIMVIQIPAMYVYSVYHPISSNKCVRFYIWLQIPLIPIRPSISYQIFTEKPRLPAPHSAPARSSELGP